MDFIFSPVLQCRLLSSVRLVQTAALTGIPFILGGAGMFSISGIILAVVVLAALAAGVWAVVVLIIDSLPTRKH